jgi:hypothetical protein
MENTIKLIEESKVKMNNIALFIKIMDSLDNLSTPYKKLWIEDFTYAIQKSSVELLDELINKIKERNNIENPVFFI